jgi:hypothetical protein
MTCYYCQSTKHQIENCPSVLAAFTKTEPKQNMAREHAKYGGFNGPVSTNAALCKECGLHPCYPGCRRCRLCRNKRSKDAYRLRHPYRHEH